MDKRKFSPDENLTIVLEALETGKITETCKKHGIPHFSLSMNGKTN